MLLDKIGEAKFSKAQKTARAIKGLAHQTVLQAPVERGLTTNLAGKQAAALCVLKNVNDIFDG